MDIKFIKAEYEHRDFIENLIRDNLGEVINKSFNGNFDYDRYIENSIKNKYSFIILCDGTPCGFLWCSLKERIIHVNTVVIAGNYQGKGIGRHVFTELEEVGRNIGAHSIQLGVQGSNQRAIGFYKALGFVNIGYLKEFDTFYMQKVIGR